MTGKEPSMSDQSAARRAPATKKPYQPPTLTVFGPLSKLTQNGTGVQNENNGQGRCGGLFASSGKSSC
jgi:hypothetical protein